MDLCKLLMPDVVAPKAHQSNRSYVNSVDLPLDSLCKVFAWWAVALSKSGVGACTGMDACPRQYGRPKILSWYAINFTISLTASNDLPIGCNKVHTSCTFTNKLLLDFLILDTNQHIKDIMIWVWLENRINVPKSQFVPTMILSHGSNEYNFSSYCSAHFGILQQAILVGMQWPCR